MNNVKAISAAFGCILLSTLGHSCVAKKVEENKPNLIYIYPDQWRQTAFGFWENPTFKGAVRTIGDPVKTPNLDKFAEESVVFTQAVSTQPVSSPYRGMLLTGKFSHRSGVPLNCNENRPCSNLDSATLCFSDILNTKGYNLAYFGKWHLTYYQLFEKKKLGNKEYNGIIPLKYRHGFSRFYAWTGYGSHTAPIYHDENGNIFEPKEYGPKHEVDQVIRYLKNENGERDTTRPFAIMLAFNAPHSPYSDPEDVRSEDFAIYKDKNIKDLLIRPNADLSMAKAKSASFYFANITGIDREFGRLMQVLIDLKLNENTIIVFTSDHGETMCSHGVEDPKNSPYSEAFNVPLIIRYPNKLKPAINDLLIGTCDIMPTLFGLMGIKDSFPEDIDGIDYSKNLLKQKGALPEPVSALYIMNVNGQQSDGKVLNYRPNRRGIKTHNYTFVLEVDESGKIIQTFFYDDVKDPYQINNLKLSENPRQVKKLGKILGSELKRIDDPWFRGKIAAEIITY